MLAVWLHVILGLVIPKGLAGPASQHGDHLGFPIGLPVPYIGLIPRVGAETGSVFVGRLHGKLLHAGVKGISMTYLEVVFSYGSQPRESELRAIDSMREVYGIRAVRFNEQERTLRVEFDASRLKQDAVAKMLRQAGVDIAEPAALA